MPRFSAFTKLPQLRFSSRKPPGQTIFEDMVRNLGGEENFTTEFDSLAMGRVYATACSLARVKTTLTRAGLQYLPSRALEQLPALEKEAGRTPAPGESIDERRLRVSALLKIARGARKSNVEQVMSEELGDDFIGFYPTPLNDAVFSPADPTASGSYVAPGTSKAIVRFVDSVTTLGAPVVIRYTTVNSDLVPLSVGDVLVVDAGDYGRRESVTIEALSTVGDYEAITATFTKPHNALTVGATGRHPSQFTSKRHSAFVLSESGVLSQDVRRRAHRTAFRLMRAVSTWSLTDGSGPFRVGVGRLGVTTIGEVS